MALIYVVEDDVNIREIECFALKNSGYTIEDFECAKDFYLKVRERVPDLVLLDIMLPDEDGLEIVKKLRKKAETRRVPIILVTAKTSEMDKVKGLDIGADDYLTKPFGVMELISRTKALLRRSQNMSEEKFLTLGDIEEIMVRVWGMDYEGESRTLDMHIKTLRQKLGESGSRIKTVRNVGYRME